MSFLAASRVARAAAQIPAQTARLTKTRTMAGSPKPQGQYLFGEAPGAKSEGWETIYIGGMTLCFVTAGVGLWFKPNTDIDVWARDEALTREVLADAGEELEVGRNYSQEKYGNVFTKAGHGLKPTRMADADEE
ncbi:Hypothetical Protein FCC1311_085522 [Hondaea fermentalgiana]|uniref:NADH dehydrogenase [ubiquinone] 1 beta subcomplex subunit 11, mitochondrial n=1 Tax=Hondaea fermentalgiana TaxID=2315210 RepID=A0A2R5GN52_9STRA|nr:Hypothetical Protein FCC1311_085522 [Hondaea fermentalgiana]|eukprot:GBG32327.1 Hypothetical Protein FCC1311_085522 [Hondaea fermentalgiana]